MAGADHSCPAAWLVSGSGVYRQLTLPHRPCMSMLSAPPSSACCVTACRRLLQYPVAGSCCCLLVLLARGSLRPRAAKDLSNQHNQYARSTSSAVTRSCRTRCALRCIHHVCAAVCDVWLNVLQGRADSTILRVSSLVAPSRRAEGLAYRLSTLTAVRSQPAPSLQAVADSASSSPMRHR